MPKPDRDGRPDRPRFRETALASGLLSKAQIDEAETAVGRRLDPRTASADEWDKAVADDVVGRGWLTPFQADQMRLHNRTVFRLGQYTVLDEIGKGGMGQVFLAEHALMGRKVAVKVLPRAKSTPESEEAFRREMRMLGRLDHENLVRAFDAGHDAKVSFLVTELVPGMDLKRYVQTYGPLDEASAASVIAQAARGLGYAHEQGLVHRDVKPGNLLVLDDGRVKVLDLGLAGSELEGESSRIGRVVGTMDYIAPEQIRAPDDVSPSADVYSLGCTLYFAVTGCVPFPGGSRKEKMQRHLGEAPRPARVLAPQLSEAFCRVIDDMMAKSPGQRIASAAAVVDRLRPWLPDGQVWSGRGLTCADAAGAGRGGGIRPPPLPSAGSSVERSSGSSATIISELSDDGFIDAIPSSRRRLGIADVLADAGPIVAQGLMVALPGGLAFGWAMSLVSGIDPERFQKLLCGVTPTTLGWLAFLVLFALQAAAGISARRRW